MALWSIIVVDVVCGLVLIGVGFWFGYDAGYDTGYDRGWDDHTPEPPWKTTTWHFVRDPDSGEWSSDGPHTSCEPVCCDERCQGQYEPHRRSSTPQNATQAPTATSEETPTP